jgi:hypothetical protein
VKKNDRKNKGCKEKLHLCQSRNIESNIRADVEAANYFTLFYFTSKIFTLFICSQLPATLPVVEALQLKAGGNRPSWTKRLAMLEPL